MQTGRLARPLAKALMAGFVAIGASMPTAKADETDLVSVWSVDPSFAGKKKIRKSISGAACVPVSPPICLVALDENQHVQFFTIENKTLIPGAVMSLLPKTENGRRFDEIDAEGAAYADGYFYVSGSHGLSRKSDEFHDSSFFVFRFPVDEITGQPAFDISAKSVAPEIARTNTLRKAIRVASGVIGNHAEKTLGGGAGGTNLEGLAISGSRMYLGFRGPSVGGKAFIMDVDVSAAFGSGDLESNVTAVELGPDTGIRDLAVVSDGLLLLAGPVQAKGDYAIHHLSFRDQTRRKLADLTMPNAKAKAEALMVLDQQSDGYDLLVMYDGVLDGEPREYRVGLKK